MAPAARHRAFTWARYGSRVPDLPPAARRPRLRVLAWASWDWGSSSFNAVITTFVFSVWLTSAAFVDDPSLVAQRDADLDAGLASSPAIDAVAAEVAQHSSWLSWAISAS